MQGQATKGVARHILWKNPSVGHPDGAPEHPVGPSSTPTSANTDVSDRNRYGRHRVTKLPRKG